MNSSEAVNGTCCSCGYGGEKETPCKKRNDGIHCEHWWDGPDEAVKIITNEI